MSTQETDTMYLNVICKDQLFTIHYIGSNNSNVVNTVNLEKYTAQEVLNNIIKLENSPKLLNFANGSNNAKIYPESHE